MMISEGNVDDFSSFRGSGRTATVNRHRPRTLAGRIGGTMVPGGVGPARSCSCNRWLSGRSQDRGVTIVKDSRAGLR